ncbi:MAG: Gfo/Idh/MocA family oxidoreductase [Spirochaetales bacterium]|nr:Gfo/Idh/MocA family oxidoreductase [Spirochaetales bacterium]
MIDICTPTETHEEIAIKAMEAGKHVIIEYPICQHKKELTNLYNISMEKNRICAAAYYFCYQGNTKQ